jgi:hypothetical protein
MASFENQTPGNQPAKTGADAHPLAQALVNAARSGNPLQALEALHAERRQILEAHHGDREATRAAMKEIRQAANKEARRYEQSNNLPIVVFHSTENAQGKKMPGVGRRNGQNWEEWSPQSHSWVQAIKEQSQ